MIERIGRSRSPEYALDRGGARRPGDRDEETAPGRTEKHLRRARIGRGYPHQTAKNPENKSRANQAAERGFPPSGHARSIRRGPDRRKKQSPQAARRFFSIPRCIGVGLFPQPVKRTFVARRPWAGSGRSASGRLIAKVNIRHSVPAQRVESPVSRAVSMGA